MAETGNSQLICDAVKDFGAALQSQIKTMFDEQNAKMNKRIDDLIAVLRLHSTALSKRTSIEQENSSGETLIHKNSFSIHSAAMSEKAHLRPVLNFEGTTVGEPTLEALRLHPAAASAKASSDQDRPTTETSIQENSYFGDARLVKLDFPPFNGERVKEVELKALHETEGIIDYYHKFELIRTRISLPKDYLDERDVDLPQNCRGGGDCYDRNRSSPATRDQNRDYKWWLSQHPPPYRDRRPYSPSRWSSLFQSFKKSRREDGGYADIHTAPPETARAVVHRPLLTDLQHRRLLTDLQHKCQGKSSQVPLFLLDEGLSPVLCTQPRRLAAVAVARMVAKLLHCDVGDEVGYHIGHSRVVSDKTRVYFKTAGVLLEEMRKNGLNALKYKVIILDEVHERSVESDLALVCVKQFLLKREDIRLVLMSATADISRYRDYFKDFGRGERVEVLAIPSSSERSIFQRRVLYLEQVAEILGMSSESSKSLSITYCSGPTPVAAEADFVPEVHKLIHNLIMFIHVTESDIEKSILVFLPTYYLLEQQWSLLKPFWQIFNVHILHSCIDTVQALAALKISKSHRKVILATNIAESSVTIPEVAYVIDSCRSLQVYWDIDRKTDAAELVWVSKSQADQRKGRTGRTCDGQVFRLVTNSFFRDLQEYEYPTILKLSLRLQVLHICCAEAKSINDPKVLLKKALDPPKPEVIDEALEVLVSLKAVNKTMQRGRYSPTFYGRLLSTLSLSFNASILALKFGTVGMLREGILLGILMDTKPWPIVRPFGQESLFAEYTSFYYGVDGGNSALTGKEEISLMGNICAYQFWQRVFKDKYRIEHLKRLVDASGAQNKPVLPKLEEEWCSLHNLVQNSLHQITEIYEDILSSLHVYRPMFFSSSSLPSYYDPYDFRHLCDVECQKSDEAVSSEDNEHNDDRKCIATPFVSSNHFQSSSVAQNLADIVKEIRTELAGEHFASHEDYAPSSGEACIFFLKGECRWGENCAYLHSIQARPAICRFFGSLKGCRNGDRCTFWHDLGGSPTLRSEANPIVPEDKCAKPEKLLQLFPMSGDGAILLVNDDDFHFAMNFAKLYDPSRTICTTSLSEMKIFDPSLEGITIMWGLGDPFLSFCANGDGVDPVPWSKVKCVLWFPDLSDKQDHPEEQKRLVRNFFEYLSILMLANSSLREMQLILTMNNLRFSQLQVEKLGRECFFFLKESFPFDEYSFGELRDTMKTNKSMVEASSISYVFNLHPPLETASQFSRLLHKSQRDSCILIAKVKKELSPLCP